MLISTFFVFSQNQINDTLKNQKLPDRIIYLSNPNEYDSLCIEDINRAKRDIAKGKIVFTQKVGGLGTDAYRYEKELIQICNKYGLEFEFELIGCIVIIGQTQTCYGDYMDKIIIEKFGIDFIDNLHRQADSLYIYNSKLSNKIVEYWNCDERPYLPAEKESTGDYSMTIKLKKEYIKIDKLNNETTLFLDLGFIVERDSTVNNFYINHCSKQYEKDEDFKAKLFEIALSYIKTKYPVWIPGKINGISVRTFNNVRIFFTE